MIRALVRGLPVEVLPSNARGALEARSDGIDIAGLRDGDFPDTLTDWLPDPAPCPWVHEDRRIGWRWRRKELENYLLDPEVLARTFLWDDHRRRDYDAFFLEILHATAERTAARYALLGLLDRWERRVVKPFDPVLSGDALVEALRQRHRCAQGPTRFSEDALVRRFQEVRPLFGPGGPVFHAWVMAGKDLLGAVARAPGARSRFPELLRGDALAARVLIALDTDPAPATWLLEWRGLRDEIADWSRCG